MTHGKAKLTLTLTLIFLLAAAAWAAASGELLDQKGVLAGKVCPAGIAQPGSTVREGAVLVFVETITGPVPAVRATADGTVREVLVKAGDMVRPGDVLVRIEPQRK